MSKKKKHLKRKLKCIRSNYTELFEYLQEVESRYDSLYLDYRYLSDFIENKKLSDEYYEFRKYAYKKFDENTPFGYFTL